MLGNTRWLSKVFLITWCICIDKDFVRCRKPSSAWAWQKNPKMFVLWATQGFRYFLFIFISLLLLDHSPVFCVAKRMMRAMMTMKSRETIVMRPISREVHRSFLADLGVLVSVILGTPSSTAACINSPTEFWLKWLVSWEQTNQQLF